MHDLLGAKIHEEVQEQTRVLRSILRVAKDIRNELRHTVTSTTISRQGDPMNPIYPGTTQTYTVALGPAGATVIPADGVWSTSDPVNAPITPDPTNPLAASVTVNSALVIPPTGYTYSVEYTYTNPDGDVVTAPVATETVLAPAIDVASATLARTDTTPVTVGSTQSYTASLMPTDATVVPADCVFTTSDPVNAPLTDVTQFSASVALAATVAVGFEYTVGFQYTNADGTVVEATPIVETVVPTEVDVTSATIERTA